MPIYIEQQIWVQVRNANIIVIYVRFKRKLCGSESPPHLHRYGDSIMLYSSPPPPKKLREGYVIATNIGTANSSANLNTIMNYISLISM